jgi:hypothetical protein
VGRGGTLRGKADAVKRVLRVFGILALFSLASSGCDSFTDRPFRNDPGPPGQITGVRAEPGDGLVTVRWDPTYVATSYNIYLVSALTGDQVTKASGTAINVTSSSHVISGLDNNVPYHFMVTGHNGYHGEGPESVQVSATPGPISTEDLVGTWYFHTLVTGEGARWERGVLTVGDRCRTVEEPCSAAVSELQVSGSAGAPQPEGFGLSVEGDGTVSQSGAGAWTAFHGTIGSRKNMMVATWEPSAASRAITIFQRVKNPSEPEYTVDDLQGTGKTSGNGATRFAYHQLSSGSSAEWEYSNCKVGQQGQFWRDDLKDVTYWDYSTPTYKVAPLYDYLWKETSVGIDLDGLVQEYSNFGTHEVVFTGRMTADRTVVVGVSTRKDAEGADTQHFLRIVELSFRPADQALPEYTLSDLAGTYRFHELGGAGWAYGKMTITGGGETTFSEYADSDGNDYSFDGFSLRYYPDNGEHAYPDFANFATPAQDGAPHYYDEDGAPTHVYYDYWSYGRSDEPLELPISSAYHNEHGTLSYNRDLFVLTRTDAAGHSLIVGLK